MGFTHLRRGPRYLSGGRAPGPPEGAVDAAWWASPICAVARGISPGAEPPDPPKERLMLHDGLQAVDAAWWASPICAVARGIYPGAKPPDPPKERLMLLDGLHPSAPWPAVSIGGPSPRIPRRRG